MCALQETFLALLALHAVLRISSVLKANSILQNLSWSLAVAPARKHAGPQIAASD